jgi:hypothetical protein
MAWRQPGIEVFAVEYFLHVLPATRKHTRHHITVAANVFAGRL